MPVFQRGIVTESPVQDVMDARQIIRMERADTQAFAFEFERDMIVQQVSLLSVRV